MAPTVADGSADTTGAADAEGCDGDQAAVLVMPENEGVAAAGVLFDVFVGAGARAAEPGVVPTRDDAEVAGIVCAAEEDVADNGFAHDADAGSAIAEIDAADAGGMADGVPAADGAVSPACFAAACQAVPVTAPAGAVVDVSEAAGVAAATGMASASGHVGVAATDEAGRGVVGATCWTGFTTS
ncbi:hypothetical protein BDI4_1170002 [Burkholderia diffusa]|nr:hypothetical protein BDI4_1170002 [Burkholderia diffusa]